MIYNNTHIFLKNNNKKNIIFCVSNYQPYRLVQNLIQSGLNHKIPITLFALDKKIAKYINQIFKNKINVILYDNNKDKQDKVYQFGSKEWASITFYRYFITHEILKSGKNAIYCDTDIVIEKFFIEDIKSKLKNNEIVFQSNNINCCTGFFAAKPNKFLINFFSEENFNNLNYKKYGGDGGLSDQKFINKHLLFNKNSDIKIKLLDLKHYPNGKYFYENHYKLKYIYIIHFNCIRGNDKKIKKMIKHKKLYI